MGKTHLPCYFGFSSALAIFRLIILSVTWRLLSWIFWAIYMNKKFEFQVINKTDLAPAVGADLKVMQRDALRMRDGGPFVFAQVCWLLVNLQKIGLYHHSDFSHCRKMREFSTCGRCISRCHFLWMDYMTLLRICIVRCSNIVLLESSNLSFFLGHGLITLFTMSIWLIVQIRKLCPNSDMCCYAYPWGPGVMEFHPIANGKWLNNIIRTCINIF